MGEPKGKGREPKGEKGQTRGRIHKHVVKAESGCQICVVTYTVLLLVRCFVNGEECLLLACITADKLRFIACFCTMFNWHLMIIYSVDIV